MTNKSVVKKSDIEKLEAIIDCLLDGENVRPENKQAMNAMAHLLMEAVRCIELVYEKGFSVGRWEAWSDGDYGGFPVYDTWKCSECGFFVDGEETPKWRYCPKCGAEMEGVAFL